MQRIASGVVDAVQFRAVDAAEQTYEREPCGEPRTRSGRALIARSTAATVSLFPRFITGYPSCFGMNVIPFCLAEKPRFRLQVRVLLPGPSPMAGEGL